MKEVLQEGRMSESVALTSRSDAASIDRHFRDPRICVSPPVRIAICMVRANLNLITTTFSHNTPIVLAATTVEISVVHVIKGLLSAEAPGEFES